MFLTLYADEKGQLLDFPMKTMLGRSGFQWIEPLEEEMIPLPEGATLVTLPGHYPVGINEKEKITVLDEVPGYKSEKINAVAALLPQGFTRTLLPASVSKDKTNRLAVYGYAAVGFREDKTYVAAVQSDEHRKWHPVNYNTSNLPDKIERMMKKYPENRILKQLSRCSLQYGCYTAQNIFYQRWEGGIPSMPSCNARCIGCISESHGPDESPQNRLTFSQEVEEIAEVGIEHLSSSRDAIISFGQGCEGEPSLNALNLSQAIKIMRQKTDKGMININTNAGYTKGIKMMCDAGLDAIRVTIFSCQKDNYLRYHRPIDYTMENVIDSIKYAGEKGLNISLNLLVFPGFTDREEEIEALLEFIKNNPVDMIQLRNLNIDPDFLMENIGGKDIGMGMTNFIKVLQDEMPQVKLGSYTHPVFKGK